MTVGQRLVVADTSVWIEHFRGQTDKLTLLLEDEFADVLIHPLVVAELFLGGIKDSDREYALMKRLNEARDVGGAAILSFIENKKMSNKGIGYVDVCLLASCIVSGAELLTLDKKLAAAAESVGVLYSALGP